jgi:hypothetical protein
MNSDDCTVGDNNFNEDGAAGGSSQVEGVSGVFALSIFPFPFPFSDGNGKMFPKKCLRLSISVSVLFLFLFF